MGSCVDTWDFLLRNSFLLLASLLRVEGLFFFTSALAFEAGDSWLRVLNREVEGGADGDREGEGLALAGQHLAEVQTLGGQGAITFHRSHFQFRSELMKMLSKTLLLISLSLSLVDKEEKKKREKGKKGKMEKEKKRKRKREKEDTRARWSF